MKKEKFYKSLIEMFLLDYCEQNFGLDKSKGINREKVGGIF